ncbi:DNA-methyltransferase [Pseudaminobacter sp. NGMCC 1.201702]|uniref:DNA-methyltransferase n=1 Tax=Pseudaminobacter sp. NGMCC 1.201702 TaxID=3391825 RepID=UPI0039EF67FF
MRIECIGNATLYNGDCLEVMAGLGPVDHVISDPPYEARMQMLHAKFKLRRTDGGPQRQELNFQSIKDVRDPFIDGMKPLNQGWLLAFCNVEGVGDWQKAIVDRGLKFKTTCIWVKPDATPKLNGQGPALAYECITTTWCGKGHARWNAGGKRGVYTHLTNQRDRDGRHPTEKPIPLMAELLADFTNPNETILDPFMGGGTTGVACARMGRRFVGIELDERYFDIACERIAKAYAQGDMFVDRPKKEKAAGLFDAPANDNHAAPAQAGAA